MLVYYLYMNENINNFMNKQNIEVLWEVLLDVFKITDMDTHMVANMRSVLDSNIRPFIISMKHNNTITLINMNKNYNK